MIRRDTEKRRVRLARKRFSLRFWLPDRLSHLLTILFFSSFFGLLSAAAAGAQDLPEKIRGYKVHKAKISVTGEKAGDDRRDKSEAYVRVGEPELTDIGLAGVTFELTGEVDALDYSGRVDFLTFHGFRVNGIPVEIEEYTESFEFRKNRPVALPRPVRIFLNTRHAIQGALEELRNSRDEWTVTGRVFVFGRFKKLGFNFKRVVPVDVDIKIKNPLQTEK